MECFFFIVLSISILVGKFICTSITHYLVKLLNFVHSYMDLQQPYAVLLALIDLEKAFNRVSHQLVIEDLAAMNVPGWLLLILISYKQRDQCI